MDHHARFWIARHNLPLLDQVDAQEPEERERLYELFGILHAIQYWSATAPWGCTMIIGMVPAALSASLFSQFAWARYGQHLMTFDQFYPLCLLLNLPLGLLWFSVVYFVLKLVVFARPRKKKVSELRALLTDKPEYQFALYRLQQLVPALVKGAAKDIRSVCPNLL